MSQVLLKTITLFSFVIFPILPGLCECIEEAPKDHGCCHEESTGDFPQHPCPDTLHLCVLNPSDVDCVVKISVVSSIEKTTSEIKSFPLLSFLPIPTQSREQLVLYEFRIDSFPQDVFTHSAPTRGPPFIAT